MVVKRLLIFIVSIVIGISVFASKPSISDHTQERIDSLENLLYNSLNFNLSAEDKINMCLELANLFSDNSYEKQVEYAARSLIISEERADKEHIIKSLNQLSDAYFKLDNYEKAIEYATRLYSIYSTNKNEIEAGKALRSIGNSYYGWSKFVEAKDYFTRALNIFKKNQYFEGVALTLRDIAKILGHWGEYDEALNKNQEALKFWEEIGNLEGMASVYNNIGSLYKELGNLESAFEYFRKSLAIFEQLGRKADIVNVTLHIGDIYLRKELYDKALEYYFKADAIGKEINNKKLKAITLSNIGEAYNLKGDYLKALDYQKQSLKIKEEIGDKMRLTISYNEMGLIYFNVKDYDKALYYMNKGLEIANEINFKYQIIKCHLSLSEVYKKLGQFDKSLYHFQQYIDGKDKVYSEENKRTIAELQTKYQIERSEKENERLRHGQQLNKAQIRNQQLIIGFVLFILLGSFVLSMIFHSRYQQNQKLNIQLSLKNKQIEEHQENVEKLNAELKETNATKDKFFSIVAHDLKNPFNSLLVLTKLLHEDYDSFTREEQKQFISQIISSAENTYSLLQNLLDWASAQSGKTEIKKENVNLAKVSAETISLLKSVARNKQIRINSNIEEGTIAFADRNMVSTIMLNLISNAVKFTPHHGEVDIKAHRYNGQLEVAVIDSGVGISDKNIDKLFKPGEKLQTAGTDKEKGTGLGLILCKEFVEKNNGKIWVESEEGKGSRFFFSLPPAL